MTSNRTLIGRALALGRVDWSPSRRQPALERIAIATVLAVAAALVADALIVAAGTALFPSTAGYGHFRFDDYAKLTVIGVVAGCAGWPLVSRISAAPRWLCSRLAVLITLVLFLPDLWLLAKGQPPRAVAVLMTMHVAVALITYQIVVHVAPASDRHRPGKALVMKADKEP